MIAPGAVVCNEAMIVGDVSIGARTVVHPRAVIIAEAGPIIIGENNLIEEQAHIVNSRRSDTNAIDVKAPADNSGQNATVMIIGNNNVFEVGFASSPRHASGNECISLAF
jgi:dynactin-6